MSVQRSTSRHSRLAKPVRLLALAAALLGLALIAGCDKPVPSISIVSAGKYQHTAAVVWCFDGQRFDGPGSCTQRTSSQPRLQVRGGEQLSVEVPQEVRKRGWYVAVAIGRDAKNKEQYQRGPIQHDHSYFSFTVPRFPSSNTMTVQVIAVGDNNTNSGIWQFFLINKDVD